MKRKIELGSQIFINKSDTPEQVKKWVRQLAESKLTLIRLFVCWDHIEPEEDLWDFKNYDACFEEAEKLGLKVIPTLMSVSPPGWMNITGGMQDLGDLDDEKFWAKAQKYVSKVVEHFYLSPALHSWILWNEPLRNIQPNNNSKRVFRKYLAEEYENDINRLNELYFNKYISFEQVGEKNAAEINAHFFKGYAETLDWVRFSVSNLCEKLKDIKNEIRKIDTVHPVHINPAGLAYNYLSGGQSIWQEAKVVDFIGCSAHPSWHSTRFLPDRLHQSVAYFADLMKSATLHEQGMFWVSELQGGTNIFSGVTYLCPTREDITHWMWESIGAGAWGIVFWCFNTRNSGYEGGEWGLLNQAGRPSERLKAVTEIAQVLEENSQLFSKTRAREADVWLLYSENSFALGSVEGEGWEARGVTDPRNPHCAADALCGAYLMLADLGLEVGFIDEERLVKKGLKPGSILILPGTYSLEKETCKALEEFVKQGGTVIADGICGMKDRNGLVSRDNKEILDRIFGAELEDIEANSGEFVLKSNQTRLTIEGWFLKCSFTADMKNVIGTHEDGKPGIIRNKLGAGTALRLGTVFFQRYLSQALQSHKQYLGYILPEIKGGRVKLENPDFNLRLKILEAENHDILILMNRGEAVSAILLTDEMGGMELLKGCPMVMRKLENKMVIPMEKNEVKIIKVQYQL